MKNLFNILENSEYSQAEKILLSKLKENESIDLLFVTALFYLGVPNLQEEKAIYYLNKILEKDPYNFDAIIIKLYNENYYFCTKDESYDVLITHNWNNKEQAAIVYYVQSWYEENTEKEEALLRKSIETYSGFSSPYGALAYICEKKNELVLAKKYYIKKLKNIHTTFFPDDSDYNPKIFIEEHILGTRCTASYKKLLKRNIANIVVKELCDIINNGKYFITEFEKEEEYSSKYECIQMNLLLTFCKDINSVSEKPLKAKFYHVQRLKCDENFDCNFKPTIYIEDVYAVTIEGVSYHVQELGKKFSFHCEKIEYWYKD